MAAERVVLVTGMSGGIGQAIAWRLARRGFGVFGTRRPGAAGGAPAGVTVLPLDVRQDASVAACVEELLDRAGRLDLLVNNAGYALGGAIEDASMAEAHDEFETNFWGVARLTKRVLPIMRHQGSGRIINVSSLVFFAPTPFLGFYTASKFALEGYTEVLRHEVKPFNIHVSLVEPGFIGTGLMRRQRQPAAPVADYEPWRRRALDAIRSYEDRAPAPDLVAACVLHIAESRSPRLRYQAGASARLIALARRAAPAAAFERATRRSYRLDGER